ncbi:hypothetical protein NEOLEDRAFT_1061311 [Neolentinus lepideus HHB14362 ss-1]|uniref:SnoaL-like domain-containing protein n=1 Tax=Neolentinus lepideus HHB14362 ss-1 TaxID=1314782 RepID=A0A165TUC4_9AGAM|nr:hypothetical protein NEOLEDRAFT_1061311 [Neolentinus lepideus HHB14362 ss-1]
MAASNELPDLETWAKSRIAALYETTEEDRFDSAFESCFSSDAQIIMNHEPVSRENAKSDLLTKRFAAQQATVNWDNVMSASKEGDDKASHVTVRVIWKIGIVAGFCTITRTMRLRIRAAPAQRTTQCTFSVKIDRDASGSAGSEDNRRIVQLWQTAVDKAAPIHFAKPHPPVTG